MDKGHVASNPAHLCSFRCDPGLLSFLLPSSLFCLSFLSCNTLPLSFRGSCCSVTRSCVSSKFLNGQPWCRPAAAFEPGPLMIFAHECGLQSWRLPSRPY